MAKKEILQKAVSDNEPIDILFIDINKSSGKPIKPFSLLIGVNRESPNSMELYIYPKSYHMRANKHFDTLISAGDIMPVDGDIKESGDEPGSSGLLFK